MSDVLTEEEISAIENFVNKNEFMEFRPKIIESGIDGLLSTVRALQAQNKRLVEALKIISQTVHEHAEGPCDCQDSSNCITEWCDSAVAKQALSTLPAEALEAERRREDVIRAAKALCHKSMVLGAFPLKDEIRSLDNAVIALEALEDGD